MKSALYDSISKVRSLAASLYDKGLVHGKNDEELAKDILPLASMVGDMIHTAVHHDLDGCAMAIKLFEGEKKSFQSMINYFNEKIVDSETHSEAIKEVLAAHLKKIGVDHLVVNGMIITYDGQTVQVR